MNKRLLIIITFGVVLITSAWIYIRWRTPGNVPYAVHKQGIQKVADVYVDCVKLGETPRGMSLILGVSTFLKNNRIGFTPDISQQALLRDGILYIKVLSGVKGTYILPDNEDLAQCLFHESLHVMKNSKTDSIEEEVDAFHAAEEARAAYLGIEPALPLQRDGIPIEEWVRQHYPDLKSDPDYEPLR